MKQSILLLLIAATSVCHAQQSWTLTQCIDYAQQHSITLKQKANQNRQRELNVADAKNARLPDLNAYASENMSFGRGLTSDNTYTNKTTSNTSFGLQTSIPLFTGMRIPNQLRLTKLTLEAATADLEKARNDLSMQVAQAYITVVYDLELTSVAQRQIVIDSLQVVRLQHLLQHGKASQAELSQQEATLANSRTTATKAHNSYSIDLLNLSQLIELPTPEGFSLVEPKADMEQMTKLSDLSPDLIYAEALGIKPEIAAEELRLKGTEYSIRVARAALYPQLSLNGSIGSNSYTVSGIPSDNFFKQLKNNFNQGVGVSLSIPLFNRFQTRSRITSAEIDRQNQMLALDNAKKTLYKEIQHVYYNTVAAKASYDSSLAASKRSEDAFVLMQAKYENGKATITEFDEAKNKVLESESDVIRAKYEYLYQTTLLQFYAGRPLKF